MRRVLPREIQEFLLPGQYFLVLETRKSKSIKVMTIQISKKIQLAVPINRQRNCPVAGSIITVCRKYCYLRAFR